MSRPTSHTSIGAKNKPNTRAFQYDENGQLALTPDDYTNPPVAVRVLTDRHRLFVEHYLTHWNPAKAAIAVGYSPATAVNTADMLLKKPQIRAEIQRRMSQAAMSANEVIARLSKQARGSLADFITITPDGPVFDFQKAQAAGQLDLIKELKTKTKVLTVSTSGKGAGGEEGVESAVLGVEVDLKLYDAQAALKLIGQTYDLFGDKKDIGGTITLRIEYGNSGTEDINESGDAPNRLPRSTNIHGRKMIPVLGYNPLDDEDADETDAEGSDTFMPLDPRAGDDDDDDDVVIDSEDYDLIEEDE